MIYLLAWILKNSLSDLCQNHVNYVKICGLIWATCSKHLTERLDLSVFFFFAFCFTYQS